MSVIGIDLGTTYSVISKWKRKNNGFETSEVYNIPTENSDSLASKIYIENNNGEINFIIGKPAIRKGALHPDKYITAIKRDMDTNEVRTIEGIDLTPVDLSAEILKMLLKQAENVEGPGTWMPEGLVVTVPYYFKQPQNINTSEAVKKAINDLFGERAQKKGKDVNEIFLTLVPEPVAAGLDYSLQNADEKISNETFLVFDLGGGTFDLTIFRTKVNDNKLEFEILGVSGDDRLGGEDFDHSLMTFVLEEEGIDLTTAGDREKKLFYRKAGTEITSCKESLTTSEVVELFVPVPLGATNIDCKVRRSDFEKCLNGEAGDRINYLEKINEKLQKLFVDIGMKSRDITSVLLTGGSSQIPLIKELLQQLFATEKIKHIPNVNFAVGRGASAYAAYLLDKKNEGDERRLSQWKEIHISEVQSHALGIKTMRGFQTMLKANSVTPNSCVKHFEPVSLTEDGTKANMSEIIVLQGEKNNNVEIGRINVGDIYTHGRSKDNITITITFIAESTDVRVKVFVKEGNSDRSDIVIEESIKLSDS